MRVLIVSKGKVLLQMTHPATPPARKDGTNPCSSRPVTSAIRCRTRSYDTKYNPYPGPAEKDSCGIHEQVIDQFILVGQWRKNLQCTM